MHKYTKEELFNGYKLNPKKLIDFGFIYKEEEDYYFNIYYLYDGNFSMYVEDKVKELYNATARCLPFNQIAFDETCPVCGKKAKKVVLFAKAY